MSDESFICGMERLMLKNNSLIDLAADFHKKKKKITTVNVKN